MPILQMRSAVIPHSHDLLSARHDSHAIMCAGGWKSINELAKYLEQAEFNV